MRLFLRRYAVPAVLILAALIAGATWQWRTRAVSGQYDTLMTEAGARYGVDPALLKAIAWRESRFDAAKQNDGAYGLLQIGRGTGIEWAALHGVESFMPTDLLDPRTNLHVGAWYLRQALDRWADRDDPVIFALADYIAGPETVKQWAAAGKTAPDILKAMAGTSAGDFVSGILNRLRPLR